jgi:septal ring factor EnvC (AmiA/AmiB activator)
MPKLLIDFLTSNWSAFLQAPLTFIGIGIIGFVFGNLYVKTQKDSLKSQLDNLKSHSDSEKALMILNHSKELREKDDELKLLNAEHEKLREQKQKTVSTRDNDDCKISLSKLSILELCNEAEKISNKLARTIQIAQRKTGSEFNAVLFHEWMAEGATLLAIKHEALSRLPDEIKNQIDRVSDSRYTSPQSEMEYIIDAINEIKNISVKLSEYHASSNPHSQYFEAI